MINNSSIRLSKIDSVVKYFGSLKKIHSHDFDFKNRSFRALLLSTALVPLLSHAPAMAQFYTVTGNQDPGVGAAIDASVPIYTNTSLYRIGTTFQGSLGVLSGANATFGTLGNTSTGLILGSGASAPGQLSVSSAILNVDGQFIVGGVGVGTFETSNNATINTQSVVIGGSLGSTATNLSAANINGASRWTSSGAIHVGSYAEGSLNLTQGSSLFGTVLWVGAQYAGKGSVNISGTGSSLSLSGTMDVGRVGNGNLTIENDGAVSVAGRATIGGTSGGPDDRAQGIVLVDNGSFTTHDITQISTRTNSHSSVTVKGANGLWTSHGGIRVGDTGTGTLIIEDQGHVIVHGDTRISNSPVSKGNLLITSGTLTTIGVAVVGSAINTTGVANIRGVNAMWLAQAHLHIGSDTFSGGLGTVNIEAGGKVTVSGEANIAGGTSGTGRGVLNVDGIGSLLTTNGTFSVARRGDGTLNIKNGGTVISNGVARVSNWTSTQTKGTANVTGIGSQWNINNQFSVGHLQAGDLNIEDQGSVVVSSSLGMIVASGVSHIGAVKVNGAGSHLDTTTLVVGNGGIGRLTIEAGGAVNVSAETSIGNSGALNSNGTLSITEGRLTSAAKASLGVFAGSVGTATVNGSNSAWEMTSATDDLFIGEAGQGTLSVVNQGTVSVAGNVKLAANSNSIGTINIGAAATDSPLRAGTLTASGLQFGLGSAANLVFNHNGPSGTNDVLDFNMPISSVASATGAHTIHHIAGNTRLGGNGSGFSGSVDVAGGSLEIASGAVLATSGLAVRDGSRVLGSGQIVGAANFNNGGTLSNAAGDRLTISGNASLSSTANVNVTLGAPSTVGLFNVVGNLDLGSSMLNVYDAGGFTKGVYRIFDYTGTRTGEFGSIVGHGAIDDDSLVVQYGVANQVNLLSIHGEPVTFWDGGDTNLHNNNQINGGSGVWNATNKNWTVQDGSLNAANKPVPSFLVFGAVSGLVIVDGQAGAIEATGMQFTSTGYVISGDAVELDGGIESIIRVGANVAGDENLVATINSDLTGNTMLVKQDRGTLILAGNNSYTGGTSIKAGVVQVSQDANLGDASGRLVFGGGDLTVTDSFTSNRAIDLMNSGVIDVAASKELTLEGVITGTGALVLAGDGTLALSGVNNYTGGTVIKAGLVQVSQDANLGDEAGRIMFEGGDLAVTDSFKSNRQIDLLQSASISVSSDKVLTLEGDISGTGALIVDGAGTLVLNGSNAYTGGTTVTSGTLIGNSISLQGNILNNSQLVFNQADNGTYAGRISGTGEVVKNGAGALSLTGNSSNFAGKTTLNAGYLTVSSALGGDIYVSSGAVLNGNGALGSVGSTVDVKQGGVHSLGETVGSQTIVGHYINHGTLRIKATPDSADKIIAKGNVDITGATLDVTLSPTSASLWTATIEPLTIIEKESAGAVVGTFASPVLKNLLFLDVNVAYNGGTSGNDVTLKLVRNDNKFSDVAITENQKNVAGAIDGLSQSDEVWRAIAASTTEDGARAGFDGFSGEIHPTARMHMIEQHNYLHNLINNRIRASFDANAGHSSSLPVMSFVQGGAPVVVSPDDNGPVIWADGFGVWSNAKGNANVADATWSTGGMLIGADAELGGGRFGLLGGYSQSDVKVVDRASSARARNIHAGVYGGYEWDNVTLHAAGGYTWHDVSTQRYVGLLNQNLSANYNGGTLHGFGELAYKVGVANVNFAPFANIAHISTRTSSFVEQSGAAALNGQASTTSTTFSTVGIRAQHTFARQSWSANLTGMIGWRHAYGDVMATGIHAFASSAPFAVAGSAISRDSAVLEAGVDFQLSPAATLGISYTGQISSKSQMHGVRAGFNVKF